MDGIMIEKRTKILLAGSNAGNISFWKKALLGAGNVDLEFIPIEQLSDIDHYRGKNAPDVILLDLPLPYSDALNIFLTLNNAAPTVPVIVFTPTDNPELTTQMLSEGAQDCLAKDTLNAATLGHSLRSAMARQRVLQQLRSFSFIDELTGLYNRRGFLAMAEHQLKLAERTGKSLMVAFVDVDGLKTINDLLGHQRGDLALIETAHILKETFRQTDILARLGGDEFVALLVCDQDTTVEAVTHQFQETLAEHNSYGKKNFKLSASIGITFSDPRTTRSIGGLLEIADKLMYEQKKLSRRSSVSYQLRFLKSNPIGDWLRSTAVILDILIPKEAWPFLLPIPGEKTRVIKKALASELLTFVTSWSLCGLDPVCDKGCTPAAENQNPSRLDYLIFGHTDQYLVDANLGLEGMAERLTQAVLRKLPKAAVVSGKVKGVLRDSLSSHLYENILCKKVPFCRDSKRVNLKGALQHQWRTEEFQNLGNFFETQHSQWEKKAAKTLRSAAGKIGSHSIKKKSKPHRP